MQMKIGIGIAAISVGVVLIAANGVMANSYTWVNEVSVGITLDIETSWKKGDDGKGSDAFDPVIVTFQDLYEVWHDLGFLTQGTEGGLLTQTFTLQQAWIDGTSVKAALNWVTN